MLAIFCAIIIKGYKEGLLNGVRTLGITLAKIAVIVFGLALPFWFVDVVGGKKHVHPTDFKRVVQNFYKATLCILSYNLLIIIPFF